MICILIAVSVLSELLPKPVRVEPRIGQIPVGEPVVVREAVEGSPARVADQAYVLDISETGGIRISAGGDAGERYARVTLGQLAKLSDGKLPCCRIVDWPALKWRGVMNDCGRNYLALDGVKAFIDVAARYKMNLFHWHLSDYQGWRLESKLYPHLNAPETMMRQVGRFYTQDEFREVVAYARERGVTVMPELDVPGHTYALRRGLGVKTMKDEGVDKMVSELFDELCALAPADVMPFVHLGTDEVRADPEYTRPGWCTSWANTVAAQDRSAVVWAPGEKLSPTGEVVDMVWYDNHVTNTQNRAFDAARMYFAGRGPELILQQTAFLKPCEWDIPEERKLGAIACCWHDDNVGDDTTRLFANATVLPAILGFANNYWTGLGKPRGTNLWQKRLPPSGTDDFRQVQDLERRLVAQRDRALADVPFAFPYVAQTEQHWRISWADGRVIEPDYIGGLVDVNAFVTNTTGHVVAETWVRVPSNGVYSAWIGFTVTGGVYSRQHDEPTPKQGEWSKYGSSIEVNGVRVAPPVWDHPGARADLTKLEPDGKTYKGAVYSNDLCETPLGNDFYYCREPSKVELREGWNYVKLDLPKPTNVWGRCWRGVFRLLDGTTAHPREVKGVEFSSRNEWADRAPDQRIEIPEWKSGEANNSSFFQNIPETDFTAFDRVSMDVRYDGPDDYFELGFLLCDKARKDPWHVQGRQIDLPSGVTRRWVLKIAELSHDRYAYTNINRLCFFAVQPQAGKVSVSNIRYLKAGESLPPTAADSDAAVEAAFAARAERRRAAAQSVQDRTFAAFRCACGEKGQDVSAPLLFGEATSMEKILPRGSVVPRALDLKTGLGVSLARNEKEAVQLIAAATDSELKGVRVTAELEGASGEGPTVECRVTGYVETTHHVPYAVTRNGVRPELGWWPDPILEHLDATDLKPHDLQSYWIRVRCPEHAAAGRYRGFLTVSSPSLSAPVRIPFAVRVYGFSVPKASPLRTELAFSPGPTREFEDAAGLARATALKADPEAPVNVWRRHRAEWAEMLADHYVTFDNIYHRDDGTKDYPAYDLLEKLDREGRLGLFSLGYWAYPKDFSEASKAAWKAETLERIRRCYAQARARGLEKHAYLYGCDEVPAQYFESMKWAVAELKAAFPGVPLHTTAYDRQYGVGTRLSRIDWFTPITPEYDVERVEKARAEGHQVWWYICCGPGAPYCNMYLEAPALQGRMLMGAQTAKYRPDGFLYYQLSIWNAKRPISGKSAFTTWEPRSWTTFHGDGSWTCCGPDGLPLPTVRLENYRDGLEDYAYVLEYERVTGKAYEMPPEVCRSLSEYTEDPQVLYRWRNRLAEEIERHQAAGRLTVRLLPDEKWWGVATHAGTKLPFDAKSARISIDIRKENLSNQTAPFMVSDKGRYVWCDAAFGVTGENGVLTFESEGGEAVRLVTAGTTLREAFLAASKAHFPPSGKTPDLAFFEKPQWNTWVELTYNQNQKDSLAYARAIEANGFPSGGVLMIDDTWQLGYGVWQFDPRRFADPKAMCDELHEMGFKVMLWVCPYVSMDSPGYRQLAFGLNDLGQPGPKGGLCCQSKGDPVAANWWNGKSATIDFSDPLGAGWFDRQLLRLQRDFGIDGWKFDAGDTSSYKAQWLTKGDVTPSRQSESYARIGLRYPLNEYRACFKMAGRPLVQRLCDKDHTWAAVQALIPEMIAAGLLGHSFVCPDMIGSGSWRAFLPDAPHPYDPELFVRSAQIHALAPMMQFSAAPWRLLKGEYLAAVRQAVETRMHFADRIVALAKRCAVSGEPMLRNLEYAFPGGGYAGISDQFVMGDFLLVAPQVEKGAQTRKVVIPPGTWRADDGTKHVGPSEIAVETPISRLPYFERLD